MRKSFKKGMAMLLAAAMVFSTPVALEKTAVKAAGTELPEAAYVYDFEGEQALQSKGTVTGAESAIALVKDAGTVEVIKDGDNNVLKVSDGGADCFGKNYAKLPAKLFNGVTADSGLTLSMKVKIAKDKNSEWSTIFSSTPKTYNEWNLFKINANLVTGVNAGDPQAWVDTANLGTGHHDAWHTVTVTISKEKVIVYLDGVEKASGVSANAACDNFAGSLATIATNEFNVLGCGGFPGEGKTGDKDISDILYDDIQVFKTALDAAQVNKVVVGKDGVANALLGDISAELDEEGKKIDLKYNTKMSIPADDLSISVNGEVVATGSAVSAIPVSGAGAYAYTLDKDGEYKLAVSAKEQTLNGKLYLAQEKTVSITVVKDGDRFYVNDDTLFTGFGVTKTTTDKVFKVDWKAAAGATVSATVKGPDGKAVGNPLTAPGNVTVSAAGEYTVDIVAKKGSSIKKDTAKFTYKAASTPAPGKTDKFSKITTKPLYKYTFDDAKEVTLSAKAKVEGGVLKLAPTAGKHGEYYAKIDSMTADDFSKGITFIADVNVAAVGKNSTGAYQDWTPFVIFGDGTPAKKDAAGATYRWAITQGFSSKAGTSKDYHAAGYYGNEISAPYTWDYFNTAANRGKWYTIAVTVKKNEMITYINGVQVQKGTADYSVILDGMKKSNNNYLGASYWDADDDFAGSMDDVAVYNTALSAADVKTLNRSGTGGTGTVTPPTGGTDTAKVSKVSITVPNRKAGKTVYMKKGDKVTLKATVKGSGKYSKSVTWKTSKKSVATVSSKGKVTAKKAGTAKITATSKTDKSKKATITIKVSKKAVKNKTLKISPTKKTLKKGKSLTIKIKKITKKTTDKITYKSSKKSVATVDAYGKVKAKKKGKATITVKCGKKSAKLKLTVKK